MFLLSHFIWSPTACPFFPFIYYIVDFFFEHISAKIGKYANNLVTRVQISMNDKNLLQSKTSRTQFSFYMANHDLHRSWIGGNGVLSSVLKYIKTYRWNLFLRLERVAPVTGLWKKVLQKSLKLFLVTAGVRRILHKTL